MDRRGVRRCIALDSRSPALESRISAKFFKEPLVGGVYLSAGILQGLRVRFLQPREISLHDRKEVLHGVIAEMFFAAVVYLAVPFDHMILYEPAAVNGRVDLIALLQRRKHSYA